MKQYLDMLRLVRETGVYKQDRTGTGTYSIFGHQMRFNLAAGFPLVTTKKTHLKSIIHELLWFLKGDTNIRYLKENGVNIWDQWVKPETAEYRDLDLKERSEMVSKRGGEPLEKWVDHVREVRGDFLEGMTDLNDEILGKHHQFLDTLNIPRQVLIAGELGPVYGSQWRSWPTVKFTETELSKASGGVQGGSDIEFDTIDQIANLIEMIKKNPDSRRLIVSAWNPAEVDNMALPPCHCLFQFYTSPLSLIEREDYIRNLPDSTIHKDYLAAASSFKDDNFEADAMLWLSDCNVPERRLSCQLYQRKSNCALIA